MKKTVYEFVELMKKLRAPAVARGTGSRLISPSARTFWRRPMRLMTP